MWYNQDLLTDLQERMEKMTADFDSDSFKALAQVMESESFKALEERINDIEIV